MNNEVGSRLRQTRVAGVIAVVAVAGAGLWVLKETSHPVPLTSVGVPVLEGTAHTVGGRAPGVFDPIGGATVRVTTTDGQPAATVVTDSAGAYRVRLPAGSYLVTMDCPGYWTRPLPARLSEGGRAQVDLQCDIV